MAATSAIEWTGSTWSPVTGCTKVSPGCARCYIERTPPFRIQGRRFERVENEETTGVLLHPERLDPRHSLYPTRLKDPIFVCSLSDLFHPAVPFDYIGDVYRVMSKERGRTFQVLTKRPERAREFYDWIWERGTIWPPDQKTEKLTLPNVWVGVSIENARYTWRADVLREIPAAVRFLSCEPLLGSLYPNLCGRALVDCSCTLDVGHAGKCGGSRVAAGSRKPLDLAGIDWVIAGGESGPGARPMDPEWARELRDACIGSDLSDLEIDARYGAEAREHRLLNRVGLHRPAFFFKQWGGKTSKANGRVLDGRTWDELPDFPAQAAAA